MFPSFPGFRLMNFYHDASSALLQLVGKWVNFTFHHENQNKNHGFHKDRTNDLHISRCTRLPTRPLGRMVYVWPPNVIVDWASTALVAHPARGQLNRENERFPVFVRAREFDLARLIQPSRPASAHSFSKPWDFSSQKKQKKTKKTPYKWRTINSLVHKIRLHRRYGKRTAESFSREKLR